MAAVAEHFNAVGAQDVHLAFEIDVDHVVGFVAAADNLLGNRLHGIGFTESVAVVVFGLEVVGRDLDFELDGFPEGDVVGQGQAPFP